MRKLILFLAALPAFGQVLLNYTPGINYTSVGSVTTSGGGCTTQPTFSATIPSEALTVPVAGPVSLVQTFAGSGCTSVPTISVTPVGGTGFTVTLSMLQGTQAILSTVPSSSNILVTPSLTQASTAFLGICWLTVPQARTPFYAINDPYRMPGTSQTTAIVPAFFSIPAGMLQALASGVYTEYDYWYNAYGATLADSESAVTSQCAAQQSNLNAWNPWVNYGTYYLGGTWHHVGVN